MKKSLFTTIAGLLIALSAFAYSGEGNGSELFPYEISSKADMVELAANLNGGQTYVGSYFKLTRNLTGASDTITTVIGGTFGGIFDGGGYEIAVKISGNNYSGLFRSTNGAIIKNLGVSGKITYLTTSSAGIRYGAGIISLAISSQIINCYNKASVSLSGSFSLTTSDYSYYAGGICAYASGCTITDCYNTGSLSASITNINASTSSSACNYSYVGGICGYATGTLNINITNCYNTGQVSATSTKTIYGNGYANARSGGICGHLDGTTSKNINNCYNTGEVSSVGTGNNSDFSIAGGICGSASSITNHKISYCYNTGNVSATGTSSYTYAYCAGICGISAKIENCFVGNCQIKNVSDSPRARIGRVGGADGAYTNNYVYGLIKLNGNAISSTNENSKDGKDAITANLQDQTWLTTNLTWDFTDVWMMPGAGEYPVLKFQEAALPPSANVTVTVNSGNAALGTTLGSGIYARNSSATIHAIPLANNVFVSWSDSNTDNPRTITAADDITLTATFASCDNSALLEEVAQLESDLNTANGTITTLNGTITTLNGTITSLNGNITTLETQNTNLQNDLNTANGTVTTLNGTIIGLENDLSDSEAEIIRLQNQLNECSTVHLAKVKSTIASIYPNPTTGIVYLNAVNNVKVYSQNGDLLQEKTGDSIDLSGYATGIYLLQVGNEWVKVVKQQ